MNSGNLLNSLLGATGANAATSKNASPKIRIDTGEQFRNALEQARPEVAAPKPAARKAPPAPAQKAEPRLADVVDSRAKAKADIRPSVERQGEKPATANTSTSKKSDTNSCSKVSGTGKGTESGDAVPQQSDDVDQAAATRIKPVEEVDGMDGEAPVATSSDILLSLETGLSPDLNSASPELVLDDSLEKGVTAEDAPTDPALLPLDASLIYPLIATPPENAPALQVLVGENIQSASDLPATDVDASILVAQSGATVGATSVLNNASSANANNTSLTAAVINQLPADAIATDTGEQVAVSGESTPDADTSAADNPDFLLLSGKAVLGKLMDSNVSGDKAAPIVDTAKPALTSTALAEPLVRLAESQSPAARSFVVQTGVPVTVGQPQWSQAVGEKVLWLAAQNVSSAEIRLDPPDLGQLHVKVSVNQDQASVTFTSPHPMVRDALDQQLNRLREMFSEQGLNLVNVDVSDKSFAQQEQERGQGGNANTSGDVDDDELTPVAMTPITSTRLVDHYA